MNNLDKILSRIDSDAEREIEAVRAEAAAKIAEVNEDADNRISDMRKKAEAAAMREYQSVISRAESAGAMAEREIMLRAKSELIEKVYRDAESFILSLPHEKYAAVMSSLLASAIIERMNTIREMTDLYNDAEFAAEGKVPFEVFLSEEDRKNHSRDIIAGAEKIIAEQDLLVPKIKLAKECADIRGGFIVRYGSAETNCSVSDMVSSVKERTYARVASILFS